MRGKTGRIILGVLLAVTVAVGLLVQPDEAEGGCYSGRSFYSFSAYRNSFYRSYYDNVAFVPVPFTVQVPTYSTGFYQANYPAPAPYVQPAQLPQQAFQPQAQHYDCQAEVRALKAELLQLKAMLTNKAAVPQEAMPRVPDNGKEKEGEDQDEAVKPQPKAKASGSILAKKCAACHTGEKASGEFAIFDSPGKFGKLSRRDFSAMLGEVDSGTMPKQPNDHKIGPLTAEERDEVAAEIEKLKKGGAK